MRATSPLVTVADARGWTHVEPPSYAKMVVSIRGLRVTVRSHDGEGWRLDVRVATPNPGLPEFRITREGFVSFIAGAFGGQDLQTGVRNFDYEYRVRSPEPDELRRVWTADRCRFLLDHVTGAVASATHQEVELGVSRESFDDIVVEKAIELAVELARAEVYGAAALRALPGAVVREVAERGPHVELEGPSPIVIGPVRTKGGVVTRATMQGVLPVPPPASTRLGSATLAQDGDRVSVTWSGVEDSPERLIAATELLRRLGSASRDGVYR